MKKLVMLFAAMAFLMQGYAQDKMTPELLWKLGRVSDVQVSPDGNTLLFGITYYDITENKGNRDLYSMPVTGGEPIKLTETSFSEYNAVWRPDGKKVGFLAVQKNGLQLFEMNPDGSEVKQVTDIEGGIGNFSYSPAGNYVSFTREITINKIEAADQYEDLKKADVKIIDNLMYRHWDHWEDGAFSHVFIAPYENGQVGQVKDLMEGEAFDAPLMPFGGVEEITWSQDGKTLVYVSKKKTGKDYAVSTNSSLYFYDLETGKTTEFEQGVDGYDNQPAYSPDNSKIAWLGMGRDGYESDKNVLYIYDFAKAKRYAITKNWDETVGSFIWSEDGKSIYFVAAVNATYQLFEVKLPKNLDKKEVAAEDIRMITEGEHNYQSVAQVGDVLIGMKQSMKQASELWTVNIKKGTETAITGINNDIFSKLDNITVEKRMVKTTDGKDMLVWVVLPPNFDPNKKYPTLLYCQGGPQSPVSQFYSYRWNFQLMASKGYIVVAPNRRGLPSFGTKWNEDISGDWGGQPIKDYLAAIDDVAKEPYVDQDRLGAVGASYGGYSVYMLAGIHEGRFKAFVSHCGLFNMESWYGTTEELFFANWELKKPYWEYPQAKAYTEFSPHRYVQNWDTPILVIHGGNDFRVPESEGMQAFQAAQLRGVPSKYLYFPNEGHWVLKPQNGLVWHREFFKWLDQWLQNDL
ncbi:S9 family peptidase [Limibacter armeniacum]|uniref:S9 family peptidase n=1 Tax=Limibacter armeniacum TaxID=466084 RepID=UPI002FE5C265